MSTKKINNADTIKLQSTSGVLSEEEMIAIKAEAETEVESEYKAKVAAEFKESIKADLKKKKLFSPAEDAAGDDLITITIDLATHSTKVSLDGREYYHGQTYRVKPETAAVLREQMFRGDLHDAEIHGLDINSYFGRQRFAGSGKYQVKASQQ